MPACPPFWWRGCEGVRSSGSGQHNGGSSATPKSSSPSARDGDPAVPLPSASRFRLGGGTRAIRRSPAGTCYAALTRAALTGAALRGKLARLGHANPQERMYLSANDALRHDSFSARTSNRFGETDAAFPSPRWRDRRTELCRTDGMRPGRCLRNPLPIPIGAVGDFRDGMSHSSRQTPHFPVGAGIGTQSWGRGSSSALPLFAVELRDRGTPWFASEMKHWARADAS